MNTKKVILIVAALPLVLSLLLSGCATGSSIRVGKVYTETAAEEVEILTAYPQKYEAIGLVESSAPKGYLKPSEAATKAALRELKKQAAMLGAHAIVLKNYSSSKVPDFSLDGDDDLGILLSTEYRKLTGEAIRILD